MVAIARGSAPPRGLSSAAKLYLRPLTPFPAAAAPDVLESGAAASLAAGPFAFRDCEILWRTADGRVGRSRAPLDAVRGWARSPSDPAAARLAAILERLTAPRSAPAGLALDGSRGTPLVMGVVNATPDSFYAASRHADAAAAVAHGRALAAAGADILDVGGESTRPGATPVDPATELARVRPVVAALAGDEGPPVSIDSRRAEVMAGAIAAGATIVNDVSALTHDSESLALVARAGVPAILMHSRGEPATMQRDPTYDHVLLDVYDYLEDRVAACEAAGIPRSRLVLDPGIGFGKTLDHNLALLGGIALLHGLGCPLLVGASRKSLIGRLAERLGLAPGAPAAEARLPGSLALALWSASQGVQMLRVHDVAETRQALAAWAAVALYAADGGE